MKHKLLRGLVALVLVCCLVVSWSPISAQAMALPEVAGATAHIIPFAQAWEPAALGLGGTVFCWVAMGLGVFFTAKAAVDAYNAYQDFTGDLETTIYYYPDGSWSYGVDMSFIEKVRAFLWDEGFIVSSSVNIPLSSGQFLDMGNEYNKGFGTDGSGFGVKWYHGTLQSDGTYRCCPHWALISIAPFTEVCDYGSDGKLKGTSIGPSDTIDVDGTTYYFRGNSSHEWFTYPDKTSSYFAGAFDSTGLTINLSSIVRYAVGGSLTAGVESPYDIELGQVSVLEVPMPEGYPEWHANARPATNPDSDEEITVLPIPLNPSADPETQIGTLTQPDIWQGSIADPMPGTGTVPDGSIAETPWEAFKKWISEGWKTIIQAIPTPDSIAEAVGNVIKSIFVPDADFITEKWNDIRSRFEFADSITATGEVLVNILDGLDPEPPVIYIDLGAAEGSYNIGSEVPFIDLRWYARYKPTMDLIVSAFLWLAFVWRLILKLPGIISGMPGEFVLMNLPVNLPHLGIGSGQRREELESGRNNRRLGDGH